MPPTVHGRIARRLPDVRGGGRRADDCLMIVGACPQRAIKGRDNHGDGAV